MGGLLSGIDPYSMSAQYNTKLSPHEETAFQTWAQIASRRQGRDVLSDLYDYDLRGWWQSGQGQAANGHLTDQYKKPNHPTFSNQSVYHGVGGLMGGQWTQTPDGQWQFFAPPTSLHSPAALQDYFQAVEPDAKLVLGAPLRGEDAKKKQ